nr:RecName: Full=Uncharacterized 26.7 kDa protein in TAR-I ttuC' 3'region; AltName: Full=ORFZ3 [Agrobacterium vitis]AAB61629.1 unknown [Agrobacterium vitis]
MPDSMISEVTGEKVKVIGKSMAIVAVGPMPGRTPTSVPSRTPTKHQTMLTGVRAVSKPSERLEIRSIITITSASEDWSEGRQRHGKTDLKNHETEHGHHERHDTRGENRVLAGCHRRHERADDDHRYQSERSGAGAEDRQCQADEHERPPGHWTVMRLRDLSKAGNHREGAEYRQQNREHDGKEPWAHLRRSAEFVAGSLDCEQCCNRDEDPAGDHVAPTSLLLFSHGSLPVQPLPDG